MIIIILISVEVGHSGIVQVIFQILVRFRRFYVAETVREIIRFVTIICVAGHRAASLKVVDCKRTSVYFQLMRVHAQSVSVCVCIRE